MVINILTPFLETPSKANIICITQYSENKIFLSITSFDENNNKAVLFPTL